MVSLCWLFFFPFLFSPSGWSFVTDCRVCLSLSSFTIKPCPYAGHQMTSSPPEELSSFFISAAAWLSSGQQPSTQGEGTSARLRIRDRLAADPSVRPSDWTSDVTAPCYSWSSTWIWCIRRSIVGAAAVRKTEATQANAPMLRVQPGAFGTRCSPPTAAQSRDSEWNYKYISPSSTTSTSTQAACVLTDRNVFSTDSPLMVISIFTHLHQPGEEAAIDTDIFA